MHETFNTFDLIFIALSLIFVIVAFFRGFVKEIFSLVIWIIALCVSYFGAPFLAKALSSYSDNKMVLDMVSRTMLFIVTFFILIFSTSNMVKNLQDKMPSFLDSSLGVLYGIVKTLLIFGAFYAVTAHLYSFLLGKKQDVKGEKVPVWLSEAKCGNILRIVGETVDPAVEAFMGAITKNFSKPGFLPKTLDDKIDEVIDDGDVDGFQSSANSKTKNKNKNSADSIDSEEDLNNRIEKETGYSKRDIDKMNRLIDVVGKTINKN